MGLEVPEGSHPLTGAAGLSADRVHNMLVCVDEAAANALRRSVGSGSCRVWTTCTEVFCQVTDP
ncbi:hypothetical protein [Streptomyces monomycini]|uniref:hypothetical protein n=1 Tax=Streptomyces monomycini TaxID=371720 RepID=UPI0004AAB417|nr:hypothetical protein [Streptomyces monomycini]